MIVSSRKVMASLVPVLSIKRPALTWVKASSTPTDGVARQCVPTVTDWLTVLDGSFNGALRMAPEGV